MATFERKFVAATFQKYVQSGHHAWHIFLNILFALTDRSVLKLQQNFVTVFNP